MTMLLDGLMRRADVAECLAVSERTVRRWGATGRLEERHIGPRAVRITEASVERLLRASTRRTTSEGADVA
jgi:excisionase family DNA binding protein